MSSHWKWAEKVAAQHDQEKTFAPEKGQPLNQCPRIPLPSQDRR